jgi:hypothetical protein
MAACGTKKTYVTMGQAETALRLIKNNPRPELCGGNIPIRAYQCHVCNLFHVTHFALGESRWEQLQAALKAGGYVAATVAEQKPIVASNGHITPEPKLAYSEMRRKNALEYWRKVRAGELPMPKVGRKGNQGLRTPESRAHSLAALQTPEAQARSIASQRTPEARAQARERRSQQLAVQTPEQAAVISQKLQERRAEQLASQTPEEKAAIVAKTAATNTGRVHGPEWRANVAKGMQEARDQRFGKAELARLFLERLPLLTQEERRAVVRLFA